MATSSNILIVDDNEHNCHLLDNMIVELGHTPIIAENGISALSQLEKHSIDLVLLDILMPGMDGYEVLERIKKNEQLRFIPVIMITGIDEIDSVVQCIEKGADDYLTKPFNLTILTARIANSLEKKRLQDQQKEYSRLLEEEVRKKTEQLSEAYEKLKILDNAKADFLRLISYELRTPLNGVLGAGKILADDETDDKTRQQFKEIFKIATGNIINIVDGSLLLAEIDVSGNSFPLISNLLKPILDTAIRESESSAKFRQVTIDLIPGFTGEVLCNESLLTKALTSLIKTAIKFSDKGNKMSLSCEAMENYVVINIQVDQGKVPESAIPTFFDVFSTYVTVAPDGGDLGLDPPVAERIIKFFGGSVVLENIKPTGVLFTVNLKKLKIK